MSTNPVSQRYPFTLPDHVDPHVAAGLRYSYNGLLDLNQAIAALTPKVNASTTSITEINNLVGTIQTQISTLQKQIAQIIGALGGNLNLGSVNLQPSGSNTSYEVNIADFGSLIVVQSVPFSVQFDSNFGTPFYVTIQNDSTGDVSFTTDGNGTLLNNELTTSLPLGQSAMAFCDGTNWWICQMPGPQIDLGTIP